MMIGNKELYLIISVLLVISIMFLIYYYFTVECFTNAKILAEDIKSEEKYRQCINENSLIEQKTNGKIKGCNALLAKLTSTGNAVNNNTAYGKLSELCPVSTLSKTPSDCLEHRIATQTQLIDSLSNEIGNLKKITLTQKTNIDNGDLEHNAHLNTLYSNKEIDDAVKYIDKNRFRIDNDEYEQILNKRTQINETNDVNKGGIARPKSGNLFELNLQNIKLNTPAPVKLSRSID
jgi:hypothetical protein